MHGWRELAPEHSQGSGGQRRVHQIVCCTLAAAEAWAGCQCCSRVQSHIAGWGGGQWGRKGGMQVAVVVNVEFTPVGWKHGFADGLPWLCWPGLSTERVTVDCNYYLASWLLLVVHAFLVPRHLYTSQLSSLCRVKLGQDHCVVPERLEKLIAHLILPCLEGGTLSGSKVPSWLQTVLAWGMGWWKAKWSCLSSLLVQLFSGFLFHCVTKIS